MKANALVLVLLASLSSACAKSTPQGVTQPTSAREPSAPNPAGTCRAAERVVRELHDVMHAEVYVTRGLPALETFERKLVSVLERYRAAAPTRFTYRINVVRTREERAAAEQLGLSVSPFGEVDADGASARIVEGVYGMVLTYGRERERVSLPPNLTGGVEFVLAAKMSELTALADGKRFRIGVLAGHGASIRDPNLVPDAANPATIAGIMATNFLLYRFIDVDLANFPEGEKLDAMIVTQPETDLNDAELRRLDELVMAGTPLAVFASAVNVRAGDTTMQATLGHKGLGKLLAGYGIVMEEDVVLEFGSARHFNVRAEGSDGPLKIRFPQIPVVSNDERFTGDETLLDASFPAFFRLPELSFPFASSLQIDRSKQPNAVFRVVARSTPRSTVKRTSPQELGPFRKWDAPTHFAQSNLAVEVTGTLVSAFAPPRRSSATSRVFVVASSQFLANPFVRAARGNGDSALVSLANAYAHASLTNTVLTFKNTIDWATSPEDLASCAELRR